MTDSKRGKISPAQLFFVIFVSRAVVSFTYVQSVTVGKFSSDVLVSFALAYLLTLLLSMPIIICIKKEKNPLSIRWISLLYSVYFIIFASTVVSRMAYFCASKMTPDLPMLMFVVLAFVSAGYGAYLGIEGIARFASFCAIILLFVMGLVVCLNLKNFHSYNFFPVFENTKSNFLSNMLLFTSNSVEPALLLPLAPKINGRLTKAYFGGISLSYLCIFILLAFCCAVFGAGADLQSFPIFTLFQMASVKDMSRLDMLYSGFWIFAAFVKSSLLIFAASTTIKKYSHKNKSAFFSLFGIGLSLLINYAIGTSFMSVSKLLSAVLFAVMVVLLPLMVVVFCRRRGEQI